MNSVTKAEVIRELERFCTKFDTYGQAAKALKVTPSQLSQTLSNKVNVIPERILKKLGYELKPVYVPKKKGKRLTDITKAVKKSIANNPLAVPAKKARKKKVVHRDAGTGRLVTKQHAAANPVTTVRETVGAIPEYPPAAVVIDVTSKD